MIQFLGCQISTATQTFLECKDIINIAAAFQISILIVKENEEKNSFYYFYFDEFYKNVDVPKKVESLSNLQLISVKIVNKTNFVGVNNEGKVYELFFSKIEQCVVASFKEITFSFKFVNSIIEDASCNKTEKIIQVDAGDDRFLALSNAGSLFFGLSENEKSISVTGATNEKLSFKTGIVEFKGVPFKTISCGKFHSLALSFHGKVYAWGKNNFGQLGLGDEKARDVPTLISALKNKVVHSISCGSFHSAICTVDHKVFVFGKGSDGQLGLGSYKNETSPKIVLDLMGDFIKEVHCLHNFTIILKKNNKVAGFGVNSVLKLSQKTPTLIPWEYTVQITSIIGCFSSEIPVLLHYNKNFIVDAVEFIDLNQICDSFRLIQSLPSSEVVSSIKKLQLKVEKVFSTINLLNSSFFQVFNEEENDGISLQNKKYFYIDLLSIKESFSLLLLLDTKISLLNSQFPYNIVSFKNILKHSCLNCLKDFSSLLIFNVFISDEVLYFIIIFQFLPCSILEFIADEFVNVLKRLSNSNWDFIKKWWQKNYFLNGSSNRPLEKKKYLGSSFEIFINQLNSKCKLLVSSKNMEALNYIIVLEKFYQINNCGWKNEKNFEESQDFKVGESIQISNYEFNNNSFSDIFSKVKTFHFPSPITIIPHSDFYNSAISETVDLLKSYWHLLSSNLIPEIRTGLHGGINMGRELNGGILGGSLRIGIEGMAVNIGDLRQFDHRANNLTRTFSNIIPTREQEDGSVSPMQPSAPIVNSIFEVQSTLIQPGSHIPVNIPRTTTRTLNNPVSAITFGDETPVRLPQHPLAASLSFFPCLFDLPAKIKLLEIDAQRRMMQESSFALLENFLFMNRHTKPHFEVKLNRKTIFLDAIHSIGGDLFEDSNFVLSNLKKPLKIVFNGEQGEDGGGLSKEFISLFFEEIEKRKLFIVLEEASMESGNESAMWINPGIEEDDVDALRQYQVIGRVLGLAIYNSCLCSLPLTGVIYHRFLNWPVSADDLHIYRPQLANGFKEIMNFKDTAEDSKLDEDGIFGLNFTTIVEKFKVVNGENTPFKAEIKLKSEGEKIFLNKLNRSEYVQLYTEFVLNKSVEKKMKYLKKGFLEICESPIFKMLSPYDLELLVRGSCELNFEDLKAMARYKEPYNVEHIVIKRFWKVVLGLNEERKKLFLKFVTGSSRAPPVKGLKGTVIWIQSVAASNEVTESQLIEEEQGKEEELGHSGAEKRKYTDTDIEDTNNGPVKRQKMDKDVYVSDTNPKDGSVRYIWRLPSAHTCANILDLPFYPSEKILKERLIYAIEQGQGSFHLV
ncbi:hypothetical protein HDU92_006130 [Lobulomyces angularis]|nr:hypothetical protein HDU92_006130 [Lobulomyces angularis]